MDAQTLSAAHGTSAVTDPEQSLPISRELLGRLTAQFGGQTLEGIEQQCRELIQTTARAVIELGLRLIFLKEMTAHGSWLLTLSRIGIGHSSAKKAMASALRFLQLPDGDRLIDAAGNKSKLFELMVLDDGELLQLNQGAAVRGISLTTLPATTVSTLRATLRENRSDKFGVNSEFDQPLNRPSSTPLTGAPDEAGVAQLPFSGLTPNAPALGEQHGSSLANWSTSTNIEKRTTSPDLLEPLAIGDRIRSVHAGRCGHVVKVYPDGSCCICWDDGEPQAEGLGHERVPRRLLEFIAAAAATGEARENGAVPHLLENASTSSLLPEADCPTVYVLLPGEFNGQPMSLVRHEGQIWLIAEEVAAALGETPEAVAETADILAEWRDKGTPAMGHAQVHLGGTSAVVHLVGPEAVGWLAIRLETEAAQALEEYLVSANTPPAEVAKVVPIAPIKPALTLDQCLSQLHNQHDMLDIMLEKVVNQLKGIHRLAEMVDSKQLQIDIPTLAEIALNIVDPCLELMEDIDLSMEALRKRIFRSPDAGDALPEAVWFGLVTALVENAQGNLDSDSACRLADLATKLRSFAAESPEVAGALHLLEGFTEAHGATLYDHAKAECVAFRWVPGREPGKRQGVTGAH